MRGAVIPRAKAAARIGQKEKAREESTSFCEQKEAKKLYSFLASGGSNTTRSGAKKFFGSFFQKRTS
jgi:hypothetical protein